MTSLERQQNVVLLPDILGYLGKPWLWLSFWPAREILTVTSTRKPDAACLCGSISTLPAVVADRQSLVSSP